MATGARTKAFCDSPGGPVFDEMVERLMEIGAAEIIRNPERFREPGRIRFQPESVKAVALKMVREAGVDVLLGTVAEEACLSDDTVVGVYVANKGRSLIASKTVIDATADGDVAASAGAKFLKGDPDDGRMQHVNFRYAIHNIDREKYDGERPPDDEIIALLREAQRAGDLHAPRQLFRVDRDIFPWDRETGGLSLGGWEIYGVDPSDPADVSEMLVECQIAVLEIVQFCRRHLPGFEKCEVGVLPAALGTRESRRVVGQYVLTRDDVLRGRKFDDGIAKAWFWIDLHDPPPGLSIPYNLEYIKANQPPPGDWYEIPYRCLLPETIKGLLVAGRCVSCDRDALGSLRIMPTCCYTGTAAGTAAALAAAEGVRPDEVDGRRVRERMGLVNVM